MINRLKRYFINFGHQLSPTFLLLAVVLFGLILRFVWIDRFPALLTQDEASLGYNAWSILQTGHDEWGKKFPIIFPAFGDAKQPLYVYLSSVLYALFGFQNATVRYLSAIAGTTSILLSYLWLKEVLPNSKFKSQFTLFGAALVAFSPWTIHLSRMALESNLALSFFWLGLLGLSKIEKYHHSSPKTRFWVKIAWIFVTALSFGASSYSYIAYRLVIPGLLLVWLVLKLLAKESVKKYINWPSLKTYLIVSLLSLMLILPGFLIGGSGTRFGQTSIFRSSEIQSRLFDARNGCHLMVHSLELPWLKVGCVAMWNQLSVGGYRLIASLWENLNPGFYFFYGDNAVYRNPTAQGQFWTPLVLFLMVGVTIACRNFTDTKKYFLALFIAILPSTLSGEANAIRLTPAIPFIIWILVQGIAESQTFLSAKLPKLKFGWLLSVYFISMILLSFPNYLVKSYINSYHWLDFSQPLAKNIAQYQNEFPDLQVYLDPQIIVEPHIFLTYWNQIPPYAYQAMDKAAQIDALGFKRPTQLSNKTLFQLPDLEQVICDPHHNSKISDVLLVTLSSKMQNFKPSLEIKSETGTHTMAKFYLLSDLLVDPNWTSFCQKQ